MEQLSEYHKICAEIDSENQEIREKTELLCNRLWIDYQDLSEEIDAAILVDPSLRLDVISFLLIADNIFKEIKWNCKTITELYWKMGEYNSNTLH